MVRLKFTGESPRLFPAHGRFEPGDVAEFSKSEAEVLVATGFFAVIEPPKGAARNKTVEKEVDN